MALLLNEIGWEAEVLPPAPDPAWEAELRRRRSPVTGMDRRIGTSPWLREAGFEATHYHAVEIPERLMRIGIMVTAQENSCRYCYGANRAFMKMLGYPESFIQRIERDAQVAEIDEKQRAFLAFCRNLARSRPRPSRATREALLGLGHSPAQVAEMAFVIAISCFYNRLCILVACPPEAKIERLANGPFGRLAGLAMSWLEKLAPPRPATALPDAAALAAGRFGAVLGPLAGTQAARIMKAALDGAFGATALDSRTKTLMFAVVARTLGCPHCESEAVKLLLGDGLSAAEIDTALATLRCDRLPPAEAGLLAWARETVYYETAGVQRRTRELAAALGDRAALLDAIGVAALANATVRLAMLVE